MSKPCLKYRVFLMAIPFLILSFYGCGDDSSSSRESVQDEPSRPCEISESGIVNWFDMEEVNDTLLVCNPITGSWENATRMEKWVVGLPCSDIRSDEYEISDSTVFVCADSAWRKKNRLEFATGEICSKNREGSSAENLHDEAYNWLDPKYYLCSDGAWTEVSAIESKAGICTKKRNGEFSYEWVDIYDSATGYTRRDQDFVCEGKEGKWRLAQDLEKRLDAPCTRSDIGQHEEWPIHFRSDEKFLSCESYHYYTCSDSGWRISTKSEKNFKSDDLLCGSGCYVERNEGFYVCIEEQRLDGEYYNKVTLVDNMSLAYDIYKNGGCTQEREETFLYDYQCIGGKYVKLDSLEQKLQGKCTKNIEKKVRSISSPLNPREDIHYVCENEQWIFADGADVLETTFPCEENKGDYAFTATNFSNLLSGLPLDSLSYICDGNIWREADEGEIATHELCDDENNYAVTNGYVCQNNSWHKATDAEEYCGACHEAKYAETCRINESRVYMCENSSWRKATEVEAYIGICDSTAEGVVGFYFDGDAFYACKSRTWEKIQNMDEIEGKSCIYEEDGMTRYFEDTPFLCQEGIWGESPED